MEWLDQSIEDENTGLVPAPESDDQERIRVVDPDDAGGFCEPTGASDESRLQASRIWEAVCLRDDEDDDLDEDDEDDDLDDDDDIDDDDDDDDLDDDLDDDDL